MDPFDDTNWRAQLHFWSLLAPVLAKHSRTKYPAYLKETIPYMLNWWRAAEDETIRRFGRHDTAIVLRATYNGLVLDRIYASELEVPEDTLTTLNPMTGAHAEKLQGRDFVSMTNHGRFQVFGLSPACEVASYRPAYDGAMGVFNGCDPEPCARLEHAYNVRHWLTLPDGSILPLDVSVGGGPLADDLEDEEFSDDAGRCSSYGNPGRMSW